MNGVSLLHAEREGAELLCCAPVPYPMDGKPSMCLMCGTVFTVKIR